MFRGHQTSHILAALLHQGRTPLEILEAVNAQTGRKTLARGSIYVLLGRLEDSGLIKGEEVPDDDGRRGGRPTRRYELTAEGYRFVNDIQGLMEGVA